MLMDIRAESIRHIDHEQRQIGRVGDPGRGDVHKVLQAPILFGIAEVKLNGMITNDKFCCTRWRQLRLSWWRRPLRLRQESDHERIKEA
jgi:hypothetical protein